MARRLGGIVMPSLGGRDIDDELELGRLYHRKVGGFVALEDTASVESSLPVRVGNTCSVAGKTAAATNSNVISTL